MNTKKFIIILSVLAIGFMVIILFSITKSENILRDSTLKFNDDIDIPLYIPFKSDSKWGLYNKQKQVIKEPSFETENWNIDPDGYVIDSRNGLFGIIDSTGNKIVPFIYDGISRSKINKNYLIVERNSKFGIIDLRNEIIIPIEYKEVSEFNTYYLVKGLKNRESFVHLIDGRGKIIFNNVYHDFNMLSQDTLVTLSFKINKKDNSFSLNKSEYRVGCFDLKGRIIIQPKYTEIENYGRYFVVSNYGNKRSRYSLANEHVKGVCNENGTLIIPTIYDNIYYDKKTNLGVFICRKGDDVIVIDSTNNILLPEKYQKIFNPNIINQQINFIVEYEQEYGLINSIGEVIIPIEYSYLFDPYNSGLIAARRKMKAGFLNYQNNVIVAFKYDNVRPFRENRAAVKIIEEKYIKGNYKVADKISNNGLSRLFYYLVNSTNTPAEFKSILFNKEELSKSFMQPEYRESFYYKYQPYIKRYSSFEEFDLCMTLGNWEDIIKGKWGFIDTKGKKITDCVYDEVKDFHDGFAEVKLNNKWGVINVDGKIVIPIKYDSISRAFNNKYKDLFKVFKDLPGYEYDEFIGYVDTNGIEYFNE